MHACNTRHARTHAHTYKHTVTRIHARTQNELCAAVVCCSSNADFRMRVCKIFAHCSISCLIRLMRVYVIRNLLMHTHTHTLVLAFAIFITAKCIQIWKWTHTHVCAGCTVQCYLEYCQLLINTPTFVWPFVHCQSVIISHSHDCNLRYTVCELHAAIAARRRRFTPQFSHLYHSNVCILYGCVQWPCKT